MADAIYAGDAGIFKTCTKCDEVKPLSDFHPKKDGKLGARADCMICVRVRQVAYGARDRKRENDRSEQWRKDNPEKFLARQRRYRAKNAERLSAKDAAWRAANPEKTKANRTRSDRKRLSTPRGRLDHAISAGVSGSLKGLKAGRKSFDILGYTLDDLMAHLELKFAKGMTWENYGQWHVDHIIPKSAFNYNVSDDLDFKRCWSLSNLQPLWGRDNIKKNAKLTAPFQPTLALGC